MYRILTLCTCRAIYNNVNLYIDIGRIIIIEIIYLWLTPI